MFWPRGLHGPWNVSCVLFGFHSQDCNAGRSAFKLRLALEDCVAAGRLGQKRISKEVVERDVIDTKLVLLVVWKANVTVFRGPWWVRVWWWYTGWRTTRKHAGRNHRAGGRWSRPQIIRNLFRVKMESIKKLFSEYKVCGTSYLK